MAVSVLVSCDAAVPFEGRRQLLRRVLDVNHAPVTRHDRRARGVNDQWTEGENAAFLDETIARRLAPTQVLYAVRAEAPQPMRAVEHAHRTVVRAARIQVEADDEHPLEHRHWRLNVRYSLFLAPRPIALD